jgi:hypothetical protein
MQTHTHTQVEALLDRAHGGPPPVSWVVQQLEQLGYNSWAHRIVCSAGGCVLTQNLQSEDVKGADASRCSMATEGMQHFRPMPKSYLGSRVTPAVQQMLLPLYALSQGAAKAWPPAQHVMASCS